MKLREDCHETDENIFSVLHHFGCASHLVVDFLELCAGNFTFHVMKAFRDCKAYTRRREMLNKKTNSKTKGTMVQKVWLMVVVAALIVAGTSCVGNKSARNGVKKTITISQNGSFTEEEAKQRGLTDKVIMIKSKYCKQCTATLHDFEKACEAMGVTPIILDVANSSWITTKCKPSMCQPLSLEAATMSDPALKKSM
jgi:hypothetical protein